MSDISLVVLTGLSGSGKSIAAKALEDIGYYTVDNLPLFIVDKFIEVMFDFNVEVSKVALVIDSRSKDEQKAFNLIQLLQKKYAATVLYLESSNDVLIRRYKETRRRHPLGDHLIDAIDKERQMLTPVRDLSNIVIDTSMLTVHDLSRDIERYFKESDSSRIYITVQSFGFKYGIPQDSDMVIDVRFFKNPHFVDELRSYTGLEKPVKNYVFSDERSKEFFKNLKSMLLFLIPNYITEGKKMFTLSIGCTGGRHRSVAITEYIANYIKKKYGKDVSVLHRDIER